MMGTASAAIRYRVIAAVAVAYLAAAGAVLWLWLGRSGVATPAWIVAVCFAPAVVGAALAWTPIADPTQYIARMVACAAFTPVLLLFWGTSLEPDAALPDRRVWPFAVAAAVGHAAAFVGLIFWGGQFATRVTAAPGALPCSADDLRARLLSLGQAGIAGVLFAQAGQGVVVALDTADPARCHQVLLDFDPVHHTVRVREKLSASAARPRDAGEASMRSPGDPHFDPARPAATQVSGKTVQTRMIDAQRLAAMRVRLFGPCAELPADLAATLDPDAVVTLLCAVATRSGWHWQPVFFGSAES